jgi:hypothetical protein
MTERWAPALAGASLRLSASRLIVPITLVQVSTIRSVGSTLSIPIMREGFVTETGLLPPSAAPPASDTDPGPAAPEQLALDWAEIARVDV